MSVSMFLNAGINGPWLHRRGASGWQRLTCAWSRQLSRTDTSSVSFQRLDHRGHKTLRPGHQSCWWVWANFGPNQRCDFSDYFLRLLLTVLHKFLYFLLLTFPNQACYCSSPFDNKSVYYGAVECLNLIGWRTFWGVQFFSGKRTTANVVPGSSLDRITVPYHFAKWFLLFQRSYNRKITKTHNDIGQTNKYKYNTSNSTAL